MEPINNKYEIKQWDLFILLGKQIRKIRFFFKNLGSFTLCWKLWMHPSLLFTAKLNSILITEVMHNIIWQVKERTLLQIKIKQKQGCK